MILHTRNPSTGFKRGFFTRSTNKNNPILHLLFHLFTIYSNIYSTVTTHPRHMCIPPGRPCSRQQRRFETAGPLPRRNAAATGHWSGQAPAVEQQMKADPDRVSLADLALWKYEKINVDSLAENLIFDQILVTKIWSNWLIYLILIGGYGYPQDAGFNTVIKKGFNQSEQLIWIRPENSRKIQELNQDLMDDIWVQKYRL
jgi:hypothetical protein